MKDFYNKKLKPRLKLWLFSEHSSGSFGDGKWRLLETIEKTNSLKSTCQTLGISYRKAWGDLKKAEQCLNVTLVTRSRGGKAHGQSNLTEQGRIWMKAYSQFHQYVENAVETAYQKYLENIEFEQ
jgi:molybdate transport system regulatory protein